MWHLDQGSKQATSLTTHLHELVKAGEFEHPLWDLTSLMDLVMPGVYEWDWEGEWRVQGDLRFSRADGPLVVTSAGVEEMPGVDGYYTPPKHGLIVSASPQPLAEYMEEFVQQFFQNFEDPANSLPVDGGEYVWIVQEWETDEALYELFPDLDQSVFEDLVSYLNGESWSWVRSDQVASIYE